MPRPIDPTPEQIREHCLRIQETWEPWVERLRRTGSQQREVWQPPEVEIDELREAMRG